MAQFMCKHALPARGMCRTVVALTSAVLGVVCQTYAQAPSEAYVEAPGKAHAERPSKADIASAGLDFKKMLTESTTRAAEKAKVRIIPDQTTVAIKHDIIVANATVAPTRSKTAPRRVMFAYVSMAGRACARRLPAGFYTIEEYTDQLTGAPHARFVNADGKTVLEDVPLDRDLVRKQAPEEGYSTPLQLTTDVRIQQTGANYAQTLVVFHRVECHEFAGWQWWEWVTITINPDGPI